MNIINLIKKPFYYKIDNKVLHVQCNISHFAPSSFIEAEIIKRLSALLFSENHHNGGVKCCKLNTYNHNELDKWIYLINSTYGDCNLDIGQAGKLLNNHPFFVETETFCFSINESSIVCSISIGQFKENPQVGTVYRLSVSNELKHKGIGRLLLQYGYAKLRERGLKLGESIISSKRKPSFFLHLDLGFRPQLDDRYISYHGALKNINSLQKFRLRQRVQGYYKEYLMYFNEKFKDNNNWCG